MIDLHGQAGLPYINRGVYTGSYEGMRYRLRKKEEEDKKTLEAVIYPEPFCFEKTAEDQKEAREFPFTDEGFQQGHRLAERAVRGPAGALDGGEERQLGVN